MEQQGSFDSPESTLLVARLRASDTPFQAWAATILLTSQDKRFHSLGEEIVLALCSAIPPDVAAYDHADLACYALLSARCLDRDQRVTIGKALPFPNADRGKRSRFFSSPLYIYLVIRGMGGELPQVEGFGEFVVKDAYETALREGTDIPALMLQLATALELKTVTPIPARLLKAIHGRLVVAKGDPEAAIAVRWLLERYESELLGGPEESKELRKFAESFVERFESPLVDGDTVREEIAAMRLESLLLARPKYRLVTEALLRENVAEAVSWHRAGTAAAYSALLAIVLVGSAVYLQRAYDFQALPAVFAVVGVWIPSALWASLASFGRDRIDGSLVGAIGLAVCYYVFAAWGAFSKNEDIIDASRGEALYAFFPVVLMSVFGAWPARRR
jgi:hypothetical protein